MLRMDYYLDILEHLLGIARNPLCLFPFEARIRSSQRALDRLYQLSVTISLRMLGA